ncbi:hypothetical protein HUU05_18130 [candidate division KSB1 bacterium]|nr:hypothetical protein [candidate division KSB1 bacterium]
MEVNEIRKLASRRPFRPIIFHLDNGSGQLISHPEIIITESIVVAVDEEGEAVYITPEAITSNTYQKASKASQRVRQAPLRKR